MGGRTPFEDNVARRVAPLFTWDTMRISVFRQKAIFTGCTLLRPIRGLEEAFPAGCPMYRIVFHMPTYAPWNVRLYRERDDKRPTARVDFEVGLFATMDNDVENGFVEGEDEESAM